MKLFTREQLRAWDRATIERHYESSADLMEVAARTCAEVLVDKAFSSRYVFFCGTGNNGGDGLVMARLLHEQQVNALAIVVGDPASGSPDFRRNLQISIDGDLPLQFMSEMPDELDVDLDAVVVDAIFGSGLNRPVEGWLADLIHEINELTNTIVAIDIPSGLNPDALHEQEEAIIEADITLTIEVPKRAMLFPENNRYVGKMVIVPLGLDDLYAEEEYCKWVYIDDLETAPMLRVIHKYTHKGMRGHLQVMAGSRGMMGACMLTCYAAMRSGVGKVTASIPECRLAVLQTSLPEVICHAGLGGDACNRFEPVAGASALVIGPGCGVGNDMVSVVDTWLNAGKIPSLVDADALNVIAQQGWQKRIPSGSIITPHVGEFDRLFGPHLNHFDRLETQLKKSKELRIFIVLKGAHTRITTPQGIVFFNATGNPGMATAGSGDVLSGIIGSLLAQGYEPGDACVLGVYMHGLAGDVAAEARGMDSLIARDIIEFIGDAYTHLRGFDNHAG